MITKSLTITRNFRTHNEDVYLKETRERVVDLQDGEDAAEVEQIVIQDMIASFKKSYPNVYTHLNFDEVRQFSNGIDAINRLNANPPNFYNPIPTHNDAFATVDNGNFIPPKPTIEEPYDIIKEINSCTSQTVLKIYEKRCKTLEQQDAYKKKVKELNKQSV